MLYSLSDICDAVAGKTLLNSETGVKSVCIDSRLASDGALFFAINGERVDGHDYLLSAAENGAVAQHDRLHHHHRQEQQAVERPAQDLKPLPRGDIEFIQQR